MATLTADEIRSRVGTGWNRIVKVLVEKVALQSISAKGITIERMKHSAEFATDRLRLMGMNAKMVQISNADDTLDAWKVIDSHIASLDAPTVPLYAHHDVQSVPSPAGWNTDPSVVTEIDGRLYGHGSADDGGGITIHSSTLKVLSGDPNVNIKVFIEDEEEMGSPSFVPFIEAHRDEFAADMTIMADPSNWSMDISFLTTSLRGNTCMDVTMQDLEHPVHSGQYSGPILGSNALVAMLTVSMYDENGDLAVPGVTAEEPIDSLQYSLGGTTVREDSGVMAGCEFADTGSLASRLWTRPSVTMIGFDVHPVEEFSGVIIPEIHFRLSLRTTSTQRLKETQGALAVFPELHAPSGAKVTVKRGGNDMGRAMSPTAMVTRGVLEAMTETLGVEPINKGEGGSILFIPKLQCIFPNVQMLATGPEGPKANTRNPNKSTSPPGLRNNAVTEALLLDKLNK